VIVAESIFAEPLHCFAPFDVGEVRLMHRYLKQVDRVIGSSFLEGASSKLSIRWDGKGTLTIQHDHAGDEALLAIAGPLRQLFDDHEAGSAASLIALLKQHAREPGLRHGRAAINELKAFTRSIDGIKATMGDVALVDERLGPDGINRRREMTFGDIVKLYLYGDHLQAIRQWCSIAGRPKSCSTSSQQR